MRAVASNSDCVCGRSAKDLVQRLLVTDPAQRLTATQALEHPWASGALDAPADLRRAQANMRRAQQGAIRVRSRVPLPRAPHCAGRRPRRQPGAIMVRCRCPVPSALRRPQRIFRASQRGMCGLQSSHLTCTEWVRCYHCLLLCHYIYV